MPQEEAKSEDEFTAALRQSALTGDINTLRSLLEDTTAISVCSEIVATAAQTGKLAVLELFREHGYSFNENSPHGTALVNACRARLSEDDILALVDYLLGCGADPNIPLVARFTTESPLHFAAQKGHVRVAERLLEAGADPAADARGNNQQPLHKALFEADGGFDDGHRRVVRLLLQRGIDVDTPWGFSPQTSLAFAALLGQIETVRFLLENGAAPNGADRCGETPLHDVTRSLFREGVGALSLTQVLGTATLLLEAGADVNAVNASGATPLLNAVPFPAYRDVARLLIQRGANINAFDASGYTPLAKIVGLGGGDFVQELLVLGADPLAGAKDHCAIESAVYWDNEPVLQTLLSQTAPLALKPISDVLLHSAAHRDAVGCVKRMIPFGVEPGAVFPSGKMSPLHTAAHYGAVGVLELCLSLGSSTNVRDRLGRTPLYMAARYNRPDAIELLLQYGADPTIADKEGRTPLQIAQEKKKKQAVTALTNLSQPNP